VRSARSGAALRMDFVCKKIKSVLMSQTGLINKHLKISCCNCGWLKSRKQVEPVLTLFLQQTGLKNQTGLKLPPNRFDFLRV
jgi:hypothetical protein